jgi:hypothetical protein
VDVNKAAERVCGAIAAAAVLTASALGLAACERPTDELMTPAAPGTPQGEEAFPSTPTGAQVRAHLAASVGTGENAEGAYQDTLAALRSNPEAATAIAETYRRTPEELYLQRQLLVQTLKDLRIAEALNALDEIAAQPIPAERFPAENAEYSSREEELIIRAAALEGILALGAVDEAAGQRVARYLDHEELTMRQLAVRGWLAAVDGDARAARAAELRARLPVTEHWLITAEPTDIRTVPHPDLPDRFDLDPVGESPQESPRIDGQR